MRSLQDYRDIYSEIARNKNITGDSVELLVQLLANASYISEVENISYVSEASLEKATLINSKIQHCMNQMYSVFRGRCPRVILKFKPTKYHEFKVYDPIIKSNDFTVYYLGYLESSSEDSDTDYVEDYSEETDTNEEAGTRNLPLEDGFVYGPCTIMPAIDNETTTIICLIAKEMVEVSWVTNKYSTYYVETQEENLSSDMWVKIGGGGSMDIDTAPYYDTTRIFSDHILKHYVFDLTTTSFSSRLYIADLFMGDVIDRDDENFDPSENTSIYIKAGYYKFSRISEYKPAELKKINLSGAEMKEFDRDFLIERGYLETSETAPGVLIIPEVDRERIETIHYKANRDRYVGSIIRTNSDVGTVLEETFPSKVMPDGTNFIFTYGEQESLVSLYYVPIDTLNILTDAEIQDFTESKKAYYIVDRIEVLEGRQFTAYFNIDIELYKPFTIDSEVTKILKTYEKRFNINLEVMKEEIQTLISKISNIKQVRGIDITYSDSNGHEASLEDLYNENESTKPDIYFKIEYNINSIIQTKS